MVNTAESKQDPSRHFDSEHTARTSSIPKLTKGSKPVKGLVVPTRHNSRKDQFHRLQGTLQSSNSVKRPPIKAVGEDQLNPTQTLSTVSKIRVNKEMYPEQVQVAGPVGDVVGEKRMLKPQEVVEDVIDVEDDGHGNFSGGNNVATKEGLNGNGFHLTENGHPQETAPENRVEKENDIGIANSADLKSATRIRSSRRNSASSRSSSVSSAPSHKQQTPVAMQMEVSINEEESENMEPLIIEGAAEDLEVSMSGVQDEEDEEEEEEEEEEDEEEDEDDGVTTDSEAVVEPVPDVYEFEEETEREFLPKKLKVSKPIKGIKVTKPSVKAQVEYKVVKPKTPRSKSLKLKTSKPLPKQHGKVFDEMDTENSDTNSLSKEDTESEDLNTKHQKSPSKRVKSTPSKQDQAHEEGADGKGGETEYGLRRSSRSRQTPQKYNSSVYADSQWEQQLVGDDRMNSSEVYGGSIRSVKGRRSLRKSRNISVLNTSLHNESSPWDTEFKVLTPCGGGVSHVVESIGTPTPLKRKALDDDELDERGQKKMCVENADLDNSATSHTSSFFSIITSPIAMLKNKLRRSTVSSTPIKDSCISPAVEPEMPSPSDPEIDIAPSVVEEVAPAQVPVEAPEEPRKWCTVM